MSTFLNNLGGFLSNAFMQGNPLTNPRVQNSVANNLPKTYSGTPIRNFLKVPQAQADYTPSPQPPSNTNNLNGRSSNINNLNGISSNINTGGGMPSNPVPSGQNTTSGQPYQQIQQQQDNGNAQIEADYNQAMSQLGSAEQGLRGQADVASGQISNEAAKTQTDLGAQQATQEQGVQKNLSTAEQQGTSAMQQARDLYRQTQQQNVAQLSALGISSSSVAEALAERLGVETARRIAGVTGSIQEVRQNATQELGRIKDYYAQKITQLQSDVQLQKQQIQNSLLQGLNQINSARDKAASDKSAARANLLSQVQQQIYSLTAQQQQFQQSLDQWAAQKSAALQPIVDNPKYLDTLTNTANTLNQQFSPTGFTYLPQVSYDKNGNMTGQVTPQKKTTDPLAELYNQAGVTPTQ